MARGAREAVEQWYGCLSAMDIEGYAASMRDDVILNVSGRTAVSGRSCGKANLLEKIIPLVMENLDLSTVNLSRRYRIMAVDGPIVAGLMQGGATTKGGEEYEQSYCQIFRVEDGLIAEIWEFFDTALAEARLFGKAIDPGVLPEHACVF